MEATLYSLDNKVIKNVPVDEAIFGVNWSASLVKQAVVAQMANLRKPVAHAKGRGDVRGGGKKPWKQKGTGRARHGSTRSPIWAHGGVSHGPKKERIYAQKINKKMNRKAILSILSKKMKDSNLKIVDFGEENLLKTKNVAGVIKNFREKYNSILLIPSNKPTLFRNARNLSRVKVLNPNNLNAYDLINNKQILMDLEALPKLVEIFNK